MMREYAQIGNIKAALIDLESVLTDKYGARANEAISQIGYVKNEIVWMEKKVEQLRCQTTISNAASAKR